MKSDLALGLFHGRWRIVWRSIRQQQPVLSQLFQAASAANAAAATGMPPVHNITKEEEMVSYVDWIEKHETRLDARDAYASAIAIYFDNLLKPLKHAYTQIDGAPSLSSPFNGYDLADVFYYASNNVRHYEEWLAPYDDIPRKEFAYKNVSAIATILGRDVPQKDNCSVYGVNYAFTLAASIGQDYATMQQRIREYLIEMIIGAGLADHPFTRHEIRQI